MARGNRGEGSSRDAAVSPLRAARWGENWTLQDVADKIYEREPSGVTPSLISAWETGRIRTSARYRRVLCDLYGQAPDVLFAFQDAGRSTVGRVVGEGEGLRLLVGYQELLAGMIEVVHDAEESLIVTGSRSHSTPYLEAIETALAARPGLVHYRVLYGLPRRPQLREHLLRLLALRDPADRSMGRKMLHIGLIEDIRRTPERFFVASERDAVAIVPSITTAEAFDTGIGLGKDAAQGLLAHGREAYAGAVRLETVQAITEVAGR